MVVLHHISDFLDHGVIIPDSSPNYYYQGRCPETDELLRLPRTALVETLAHGVMKYLASNPQYFSEGKMYGILLIELPSGEQRILKAFSGMLNSYSIVESWVPPIPGREQVAVEESRTLAELENIKQQIITLKQTPQREQYKTHKREFELQLQQMSLCHQQRKQQRQAKRRILEDDAQLDKESCQDGIEKRKLKRLRDEVLQPLKQLIEIADTQILALKRRRKELSRQLQVQMHAAYSVTNFFGQSLSLQQFGAVPTGTGDCCAPKLLHYAATNNLKPLAMAEFWWGSSSNDKIQGRFYGACVERCQPLMGFLLSGMKIPTPSLPILYEDQWVIIVNKPAGLLSVPGRYSHNQDSVISRFLISGTLVKAVHRLDQDTSGILLLARDVSTHRLLSQQFQLQQIHKVYEALLDGVVNTESGVIQLPLWANPENPPYQEVNWEYGKNSVTKFTVIGREGDFTRVEFVPLTGRTHQLRVHAADYRGLGRPILGDRLYGFSTDTRLHLHAREICFMHPQSGENLHLYAETPF